MWYGNATLVFHGNPYTISSTYHNGQLKMYATHPALPTNDGGNPQYYVTQL
jgi:hypothetical protein